jgi:hypothetical protein
MRRRSFMLSPFAAKGSSLNAFQMLSELASRARIPTPFRFLHKRNAVALHAIEVVQKFFSRGQ